MGEISKRGKLDDLVADLASCKITRRKFVKTGLMLGFSTTFLGGIIAGHSPLEAASSMEDVPEECLKAVRKEGSKLNVMNWAEFIDTDRVKKFEEEFKIKVTYDAVANSSIMKTKISAGKSGYDVFYPSDYMVFEMKELNLIQPLNHDWIPNLKTMIEVLLNPSYDPGNKYSSGYNISTTGHAYNKDKVSDKDPKFGSHAIIFEGEEYKDHIGMLKYTMNLIGPALKYLGHSINTGEPWSEGERQKLMQAKELLLNQKPLLAGYFVSTQIKEGLASNELWLADYYNGGTLDAQSRNPKVEFYLPKEGDVLYAMPICIPSDASHPAAAHLWMNYVLRPKVQAAIAEFTKYPPGVTTAGKYLPDDFRKNPAIFPTKEQLKLMEYRKPITGKNKEVRSKIMAEVML